MERTEEGIDPETGNPTLLFSVNTYLAYAIAQKYYNQIHYAWFATQFDYGIQQPASSNPRSICHDILETIASNDHHCEKLERIKNGILDGAYEKLKKKVINDDQELEIRALVRKADEELNLLIPVVFVAQWDSVKEICEKKGPGETASPTSIEYLIRELPRIAFDIIDMKKLLINIDCFSRGNI